MVKPGQPKVNINRNLVPLNRLSCFHGGHMSNDVIVLSIVKPQIGWGWVTQLSKVLHIFILCFYLKKLSVYEMVNFLNLLKRH